MKNLNFNPKLTTRNGSLRLVNYSQGEELQVVEKELQKQIVLDAFSNTPKTMKMVEVETGIQRTNFTSLLNSMFKYNAIYKPYFKKCKITGINGVGYYTTNESYKPKTNQLNLFRDAAA
jgi:hypothetical protein